MPNINRITAPWIPTGNPDTVATPIDQPPGYPGNFAVYDAGSQGCSYDLNDQVREIVTLDSGATAATPTGAVLANSVAFWKDKSLRLVTNDIRFALNGSAITYPQQFVAGIFRIAVPTPGKYGNVMHLLSKGYNVPILSSGVTAGTAVMADNTAGTSRVINATAGNVSLGVARTATANGSCNVDFDVSVLA